MSLFAKSGCFFLLVSALAAPLATAQQPQLEQVEMMKQFVGLMQGYYALIEQVHAIAADPEKSAILELQKIEDIYKNRGDRADAIVVLREVVQTSPSPSVRNAAAFMLAEALNETGQASEAVRVLTDVLDKNLKSQ